MHDQKAKILIVGAGPTGMTAAMECARFGLAVRLIDRTAEPATTSRAIGVQARTLELFQQRGLVQPMLERGNQGIAGSIYGEGKRIFRLEYKNNGSEYPYMLFISQAETEEVLRAALQRLGVTIEREVEFLALAQTEHAETVQAVLRHKRGVLEHYECDYLIDCEGAHSIARTTMNIGFEGKTRAEGYALADVHFEGDLADSDFHIFSSEHGFLGMFPLGKGRFRLIASNPQGAPRAQSMPSREEIQGIYDQRSPVPGRFRDMTWSSWFRINSRMVHRLRVGRVFLGGDSAHIHSPAGAQGMNTGIQDMINLGWKLAMVVRGEADPRLLDTYEQDRLPVIKDVLRGTEGLTDAIGSEERLFRLAFAYVAPLVVSLGVVQHRSTEQMSQIGLHYRHSPISVTHSPVGTIHAGDRVPDVSVARLPAAGSPGEVAASTSLYSLLSPDRFTLLCTSHGERPSAHDKVHAALRPWSHRVQVQQIGPGLRDTDAYRSIFGKEAGCS